MSSSKTTSETFEQPAGETVSQDGGVSHAISPVAGADSISTTIDETAVANETVVADVADQTQEITGGVHNLTLHNPVSIFGTGSHITTTVATPVGGPGGASGGINFIPYNRPAPVQAEAPADFKLTPDHLIMANKEYFPKHKVAEDFEAPDCDEIILWFGDLKINVHRPIIKKSPMLNACFNHKMREGLSGEMTPSEGDFETWMVLLLAMYDCKQLPRGVFKQFPGVLLVNALDLADYCMTADDVKENLATLMTDQFARMNQWREVPLNSFTHVLHDKTMQEINETYLAYRDCNARFKPFPLESFGVMIALLCPFNIYLAFEKDLDDGLIRFVAFNSMKLSSRVPIEAFKCDLFMPRIV